MTIQTPVPDTTSSLRPLVERSGPFVTAIAPAPSEHADSAHRYDIVVRDLLSELGGNWEGRDEAIAAEFESFGHDAGEAVMIIAARDGYMFGEAVGVGVDRREVSEGEFPRLMPLIEARQMTVAHVVVETDKSGADIVAYEAGRVIDVEEIEVENRHIHRGRPGGWSHRRYQQRAENSWHDNADNVADTTLDMADECDAEIIFVIGPPRARSMVVERLSDVHDGPTVVSVESGEVDGAIDEMFAILSDHTASLTAELIDELRASIAHDRGSSVVDEIDAALTEGRVEMLLVHEDGAAHSGDPSSRVDEFVSRAIVTDAAVRAVPAVSDLQDGVGAIFRW